MSGTYSPGELSAMFTEIGGTLATQGDRDAVLASLVDIAAARIPGATHAGVTIGRTGRPFETVAATDERVLRTDRIQYDLGHGPCVDAIVENTTFNASDLRNDPRWPDFGRRAAEETGILSMLSLRLYVETDSTLISGLNLYADRPGAFDAASETIAVLLATHGALAVAGAQARNKASNLEIALKSSREIGIAMGVLMARNKVTREQAFDLLRIASQYTHRKVADLASEVADTGTFPSIPTTRSDEG